MVERLGGYARGVPGGSLSGMAQRLVDEGLRMADHPGVLFKDGPAGRRAALAAGPDVWEVIRFLREVDERGDDAVLAATEVLNLPPSRVQASTRYYAAYPMEIDAEIAAAETASKAAEAAWRPEQHLLA